MNPLTIAAVLTLLIGLTLLLFGIRGRRVGEEPRCRKCKYNLTGLGVSLGMRKDDAATDVAVTGGVESAGGATCCPECGNTLDGRRATVRGMRRKRLVCCVAGVLCLVVAVPLGVFAHQLRSQATMSRLPVSVLMVLARLHDGIAWWELARRNYGGNLNPDQSTRLEALALAEYENMDPRNYGRYMVGSILDDLVMRGNPDEETLCRYWEVRGLVQFEGRGRVRLIDDLTIDVLRDGLPGMMFSVIRDYEPGVLAIHLPSDDPVEYQSVMAKNDSATVARFHFPAGSLASGKYEGDYRTTVHVSRKSADGTIEPWFDREAVAYRTFEVMPEGIDSVTLVKDPAQAQTFRSAITISATAHPSKLPGHEYINLSAAHPAIWRLSGAFEVFGEIDGQEYRFGELVTSDSNSSGRPIGNVTLPATGATEVTPILRSSADVAREFRNGGLYEIWDGEIRFDPIVIERSDE